MSRKSVIIVGAGIAGLSAGCYAAMNGYHAHIHEMHTAPGGLCTAWKRGGYTIDSCINWLIGSRPGTPFHGIWEELGAVQGRQFIFPEQFLRYEARDGRVFSIFSNLDRQERHMLEIAPEDADATRRFCAAAREFSGVSLPVMKPEPLMSAWDKMKAAAQLARLKPFVSWNGVSMTQVLSEFKSPLIKAGIRHAWPESFPAGFLFSTLAWLNDGDGGYPLGGSLEFSQAIDKRFRELGGEVSYKSKVAGIIVRNDTAVGVRLDTGAEHYADAVISAADGHATIFDWLQGKYVDETTRGYYKTLKRFPSLVYVALGVKRTFDDVPVLTSSLHFELAEPLTIAESSVGTLGVRVFNNDRSHAPAGRTTLLCAFGSDYEWWKQMCQDASCYCRLKNGIADRVVTALDGRFPGLASRVEMRDVATPLTIVRYTGNWQGSFEGWMVTPETWMIRMPRTLPGLKRFWMCGQWVEPGGGIPPAALSGRDAVQFLCAEDKKRFTTCLP